MTTTREIVDRAATVGIDASVWEKHGKLRIYARTGRKDMSVFLDLDGTKDDVEGARLVVTCSTPQHKNWVNSQIKQYKQDYVGLFHSYVVEMYRDCNGEFGNDINCMIDEARKFFAEEVSEHDDN